MLSQSDLVTKVMHSYQSTLPDPHCQMYLHLYKAHATAAAGIRLHQRCGFHNQSPHEFYDASQQLGVETK
jgi:hypothetical protein